MIREKILIVELKITLGWRNLKDIEKLRDSLKIASKFNFLIVTFIDTPGAFPGVEAEDRGTIRGNS